VNDNNDVVEVHQVASDDRKLHYTRAKLLASSISFGSEHPRYDDDGSHPALVILNNCYLVETHTQGRSSLSGGIPRAEYRTGTFNTSDATRVSWSTSSEIARDRTTGELGTNGAYLVATFSNSGTLYYSWAVAP
jgi:hypothetical protein